VSKRRGRKPIADAATVDRWKKMYRSGLTLADIAEDQHVSIQTVSSALRKIGVTPGKRGRPPGRPGKKQPIEKSKYARHLPKWVQMYKAGQSVNQIARAYNLHPFSVQYALNRTGLKMRGGKRTHVTPEMVEQWATMYKDGIGSRAIGKKFGVNETTVRRRLKSHGVTLRKPGSSRKK